MNFTVVKPNCQSWFLNVNDRSFSLPFSPSLLLCVLFSLSFSLPIIYFHFWYDKTVFFLSKHIECLTLFTELLRIVINESLKNNIAQIFEFRWEETKFQNAFVNTFNWKILLVTERNEMKNEEEKQKNMLCRIAFLMWKKYSAVHY